MFFHIVNTLSCENYKDKRAERIEGKKCEQEILTSLKDHIGICNLRRLQLLTLTHKNKAENSVF